MKKMCCLTAALCAFAQPVAAADFSEVRTLSQDAFRALSKDLASVIALRALAPGVNLNLLGVDVGIEAGITNVADKTTWEKAGGGSTTVFTPRVTIHKAFSGGLDLGLAVGLGSSGGAQTIGGIARYQLIDAGVITPSAMLRLSGNRDLGSTNVGVSSYGADFVVAKPLLIVTPYVGAGVLRTNASAPGTTLRAESASRSRLFVGFDTHLPFAALSAEAERIAGVTTVSTKVGFKF